MNDTRGPANEDAQTLTVTGVADKGDSHGTVTLDAGQITYTPAPNYHGPASFEYTVCDNGTTAGQPAPLCATGVVTVGVAPVNDRPVFVPLGPLTVNAGSALTFTLAATDPDVGDVLTFTSPDLPPGATLTPQGAFNWTACRLLTSVNITFVVTDPSGASDTMNVTVTVVGVLDQLNQLSAYLDGLGLDNKDYEPLDAQLDYAIGKYDPDDPEDTGQTCDGLQRFINGVRQRENSIGAGAAASLINAGQALQNTLGCGGGLGSGC